MLLGIFNYFLDDLFIFPLILFLQFIYKTFFFFSIFPFYLLISLFFSIFLLFSYCILYSIVTY